MLLFRNSIRQLFRMKGRAVLFLLLLIFAAGLCSIGRGFLITNQAKMEVYEDSFMTIGTVEQKADRVMERMVWDAEMKDYHIYNGSVYDSYVPLSVLDFEGADYLSGPERRCFYGSYMPQYEMYGIGMAMGLGEIVEGSPVEDAVPDHPIKFKVSRVLAGKGIMEGNIIDFCDHRNPEPEKMYADKTYVMSLMDYPGHEYERVFAEDYVSEYIPYPILESDQVYIDGKEAPDEVEDGHFCDEVTEAFYESDRGKRWLNVIAAREYILHIFPVTGTNDIDLMMAFYNGDAYISQGREFTAQEYARGDRVCLVSEFFAQREGLEIGDELPLALMYANYKRTPGSAFGSNSTAAFSMVNAKGEIYPVFEEGNYKIIGMYGGQSGLRDEYGLGYNEIIIPSRSVKNSDADNIIQSGPMIGSNTSFRIANGTIDEYMEKWNKLRIPNVEITFYDRGYSKLESNINNMKYIARLLMVMGVSMVLMVLGYFSWLFILKQKERTAVERCLGFRKWQSFLSLFSGIFLIILLGSLCGAVAGSYLSGEIGKRIQKEDYYDKTFGNSVALDAGKTEEEPYVQEYPLQAAVECALMIVAAGTVISAAGIYVNLRKEPMKMLAGRDE
ncbi:MAG: ABC transporter permease [Lachnospiraceae bacterium]|nr:ABC transporter permease [Lachnospiraceae bacterium]